MNSLQNLSSLHPHYRGSGRTHTRPDTNQSDTDLESYLQFHIGNGFPTWWYIEGDLRCASKGTILGQYVSLATYRRVSEHVSVGRHVLVDIDDSGNWLYDKDGAPRARCYPFIRSECSENANGITVSTDGLSGPWASGKYGISRNASGHMKVRSIGQSKIFSWSITGEVAAKDLSVPFIELYSGTSDAPYMYFQRIGLIPQSLGEGEGVWQAVGKRFENYDEIPQATRLLVDKHLPKYVNPPNDTEIKFSERYMKEFQ